MKNYLQNKTRGLKRRMRCIRYGMFYILNEDYKIPGKLLINGTKKEFRFKNLNVNEFTEICINDCYRLGYLKKKIKNVRSIVDIGANQGLFLIAARQYFSGTTISGYEPNKQLEGSLSFNANQLNSKVYYEAVMKTDCMVDLHFIESDLATTALKSENGTVPGISFQKVIERAGSIDILKMDCEGSEWELLEDIDTWKDIKSLCMEYHLWGSPRHKTDDLFHLLNKINFQVVYHHILSSDQGYILAFNNAFVKAGICKN